MGERDSSILYLMSYLLKENMLQEAEESQKLIEKNKTLFMDIALRNDPGI